MRGLSQVCFSKITLTGCGCGIRDDGEEDRDLIQEILRKQLLTWYLLRCGKWERKTSGGHKSHLSDRAGQVATHREGEHWKGRELAVPVRHQRDGREQARTRVRCVRDQGQELRGSACCQGQESVGPAPAGI